MPKAKWALVRCGIDFADNPEWVEFLTHYEVVMSMSVDFAFQKIFIIAHDSFAEIAPGTPIPVMDVEFTRKEIITFELKPQSGHGA